MSPSPGLSYIIGVYLGDGYIRAREREYHYIISLKVKDKEFAKKFARYLKKLGLKPRIRQESDGRRLRWVAEAYSKSLYIFLKQSLENLVKIAKRYPKEFLQGLFDSEGCTGITPSRKGLLIRICLINSNLRLLQITQQLLEDFSILSKIQLSTPKGSIVKTPSGYSRASSDIYRLVICRKDSIKKFATEIGFSIKRKYKKLIEALRLLEKYHPRKSF